MTVVAAMATGAHALSLTAPAVAGQAEGERETLIEPVQSAPTAAGDGLPIPLLASGVVLGFLVGLGAGTVYRRRRRSGAAAARPHGEPPRAITPPPSPPAPPRPPTTEPAGGSARQAPAGVDQAAARRVAHARPWPDEAEGLWTCEIGWKPGYRKSSFRAMAAPPGESRRRPIGESPPLGWTLWADPEPPTHELVAAAQALLAALVAAGWERTQAGGPWYAQRFLWRGSGEPGPIRVPDLAGAEPPPPG
jgi:hypothetical protein